ncbi:alpha/beta hydrolase [Kosakonia quasisacchari]|uniref:Alpha/beta hydrolase n=1 Tax=Kosakonia quasisacchari TaxID=2529380 RepID=A0A4R0HW06_9ENTR|nr:alpha/beta hydrolase [Kosakonia quasisacchari]
MRDYFRNGKRFITAASCAAMLSVISAQAAAQPIKNIVLVHGAFADGSGWAAVTERLQTMGYHVSAVQNPLTSLDDDVAATERVLARQHGDVLLVGHSWAGAVISQAGNNSKVRGLVYLSALAPTTGESVTDLLARLNAPMTGLTPDAQGLVWLDDASQFQQVMANDISTENVQALAAVSQPIAVTAFQGKIAHAAWENKPSWYLLTENDHALLPAVQEKIAKQIHATVYKVNTSHLSMVSQPDAVAKFIDTAAKSFK